VTKNTEYHMRSDVCVGVRRVGETEWNRKHWAVGQTLIGGIGSEVTLHGQVPGPGSRLLFDNSVLTTPVTEINRPSREVGQEYADLLAS
jgi:hypothetical protein